MAADGSSDTMAFEAEYLGMTGGTMFDKPKLIITFRPAPKQTFFSQNFAFSKEQAIRMREDLNFVLENYDSLQDAKVDTPPTPTTPPPKKPRKRKGE